MLEKALLIKWFIALEIQSAKDITMNNLVFCNIMKSKFPDILTTPFIFISPTSGKVFSKAKPGCRGESSTNTFPIFWTFPREASIPIIKGFIKLDLILLRTSDKLIEWTGYSKEN